MSLTALLLALPFAMASGTVLSLGGVSVDPPLAGQVVLPAEAIVPDVRWTPVDEHAMRNLGEELLAVRPLMHKFDGELEIMVRLEEALGSVHVIRSEEERRLLYVALAFQGFAVKRYFQDELATDPAAESFRIVVGERVEVKAWVDAIALDPYREPTRLDISEQPELAAFQATRARMLFMSPARVWVDDLPPDAVVLVDGQHTDLDFTARSVPVLVGRHRIAVLVDGKIVAREDVRLDAGQTWRAKAPPSRSELDALLAALASSPSELALPPHLSELLGRLPAPVHLAVPGEAGTALYRVDGERVVRATATPAATEAPSDPTLPGDLHMWIGGSWLYDDSFYMLNHEAGAEDTYNTSNAFAPSVGMALVYPVRDEWVAGGGVDLVIPTGEWHHVPVDGREQRLRAHPYAAIGFPGLQFTFGGLLPWHVAMGARFQVPIAQNTDLVGGFVLGTFRFRPVGDDLDPAAPRTGFVAISTRIGR